MPYRQYTHCWNDHLPVTHKTSQLADPRSGFLLNICKNILRNWSLISLFMNTTQSRPSITLKGDLMCDFSQLPSHPLCSTPAEVVTPVYYSNSPHGYCRTEWVRLCCGFWPLPDRCSEIRPKQGENWGYSVRTSLADDHDVMREQFGSEERNGPNMC